MSTQPPRPDPGDTRHLVLAASHHVNRCTGTARPRTAVRPSAVHRTGCPFRLSADPPDPEAWRRAVHLDRVAALLEPLAGLDLSEREHAIIEWLAGWDIPTVAAMVRILWTARAAASLAESVGTS